MNTEKPHSQAMLRHENETKPHPPHSKTLWAIYARGSLLPRHIIDDAPRYEAMPEILEVCSLSTTPHPPPPPRAPIPGSAIQCGSVTYGLRSVIAALPAWFRFAQCLRRYRDTRLWFPHLVNAGKYSTSFFVIFFSSLAAGLRGEWVAPVNLLV